MADPVVDRVEFARQVLGVDPFEHQREALWSVAPFVVVAGGRRSGKSEAAQVAALHGCLTRAGGEWLVTSANADNARQFVAEAAELARGTELGRGAVVDVGAMRLDFANGSALVGLPPTPGQLRGMGRRVVGLTVEEAGFAPAAVWRDARYVLLDNRAAGAQAWLIGSPWGGPEHFFRQSHRAGLDGDPDFFAATWRTAMNPRLPADWIDRERGRLNALEAAAELDGEWASDGEAFFPRELLDAAVVDVELPALDALAGQARGILGVDYGVVYDHSAAVGLFRLPVAALNPGRERRPVFVALPHVWPQRTELRRVVDEAVGWPVRWRFVATEVVGVGHMPSQELIAGVEERLRGLRWQYCLIHTSSASKLASYGLIRWLLERGQLRLPRHPQLLRQLAGLRLQQLQQGQRIEAEDPAVHDDVADALAFCAMPYSRRGSRRLVCGLAQLADAHAAVPDADPGPVGELVTAPDGLVLPRRPALQSVAGRELTLPALRPGAAVARRPRRLDGERLELRRRVLAAARSSDQDDPKEER